MPALYVFTPRALDDLDSIWTYIAKDNLAAADRVQAEVFAAVSTLVRYPQMGSIRADITHRRVRFWTLTRYPNFVVVYRPDTTPLQVLAVLHSSRNLQTLLSRVEPRTF